MSKHPIPDAALDDRLAFIGTSGSGKTYNAGSASERILDNGARAVFVDPLDVWYGLALAADGKKPSPYRAKNRLVIFGGRHGDLPINEHSGALIGETVATMAESAIVSLGGFDTAAAERRFMLAFLDAIYRKATGAPFHLIVDEADMFAPQKPAKGDEKLLNRMEQIVRRGRIKGFVPWLISQRPAVLNKNVLSQADGLIAFKLTASQDRDALGAWIEGQADRQRGKEILAGLPTLQIGQGVVWIPGRGVLDTVAFPAKKTFDSSRTPKRGERVKRAATLKPVNLGALKEKLATLVEAKAADDPAALRKRIAELERAAKAKPAPAIDAKAIERAEASAYEKGRRECVEEYAGRIAAATNVIRGELEGLRVKPKVAPVPVARSLAPVAHEGVGTGERERPRAKPVNVTAGEAGDVPEGARKILTALIQFDGCEREQLTVLTDYRSTSLRVYTNRLVQLGYAEKDGARFVATEAGRSIAGDAEPLPTGLALQDYWRGKLATGEWAFLEIAINAYPASVDREGFAGAGYKPTSQRVYLNRLKARRLLVSSDGGLKAAEQLF